MSRLRAESPQLAVLRQERPEPEQPQRPGRTEQLEVLSHVPVRLEVARAVDELLLTVGEREAAAAERKTWVALLNHQILIRRRWPEA